MEDYVFGYGSLVNRQTHGYAPAEPARLVGWRRAWRRTDARARCYLTVVPAPEAEIWGLAARVPERDWPALDHRERGYARHRVTASGAAERAVTLYAIPAQDHRAPGRDDPLALSYIDTVVAGYLAEFGAEGAAHFFATTDGWQAPVIDDRARPLYGRAAGVSAAARAHTDAGLAAVGARVTRG
jgi:hypothetical protein